MKLIENPEILTSMHDQQHETNPEIPTSMNTVPTLKQTLPLLQLKG